MWTKLSKAFDESLARLKRGETLNSCLGRYPRLCQQLEPLLLAAESISAVPGVSPSPDFRKRSKSLLMARLRREPAKAARLQPAKAAFDRLSMPLRILERAVTGPARVAVPVALVLLLILQSVLFFGSLNFFSSASVSALASRSTLTTFDDGVQLKRPGSTTWEAAVDGTTLEAGTRVQIASNSNAVITFFNGTTVELEPDTDLMVEQLEAGSQNQPTVIVLRQWFGKTLSRVTKLADPGSKYGIQTPSAYIAVRGTLFVTEVDETGAARVQTIEGLVSVSAQGEEVYLPAGQQTAVEPGAPPSKPVPINHAEGAPQEQKTEGLPAQSYDNEKLPSQNQDGPPASDGSGEQGQWLRQSKRNLWVSLISGVVLLLWIGTFLVMEKQRSVTTRHRRRAFDRRR
ncbi:MAG: FecR domain-containing protein [Chloroflexi bacterium]|nr:FecR domain-containing protein [Chloroflexota bacterium]